MRALLFVSACLLAVLACSSAPPTRSQYLLRTTPPAESARLVAPLAVGIGRITVASYLDQPGLVVETDTREVSPARQHTWAEPLDAGIRSLLGAELSRALGFPVASPGSPRRSWAHAVDLDVDQLHGTMAGAALLSARFQITSAGSEPADYHFSRSRPLAREGYAGLVDAEAALIGDLADAIADALRAQGLSAAP